jgi:hypothetical protein
MTMNELIPLFLCLDETRAEDDDPIDNHPRNEKFSFVLYAGSLNAANSVELGADNVSGLFEDAYNMTAVVNKDAIANESVVSSNRVRKAWFSSAQWPIRFNRIPFFEVRPHASQP